MVWRVQLTRDVESLPITRDYIAESEKAQARIDA